jgi:nucleotide-binding universal stress UspA family protein
MSDLRGYAEAVIFGSGRPTLVLPETPCSRPFELGTVAVAWDFSRAAARAVSDALPLLERARKVRVVVVTNEKILDTNHSAEALGKNLARHGIDVVLDSVDANGRPIGEVLETYALAHQIDVLVMGAYGHAKWREFILGGAIRACCPSRRSRSCSRTNSEHRRENVIVIPRARCDRVD